MASIVLVETIDHSPEKIDENTIQFAKTEKWEITKTSLLSQKEAREAELLEKQNELDKVNQLLQLLG